MLLAGLATRLHGIHLESPWNDEVLTLRHVDAPSLDAYLKGVFDEDPVPLMSPGYYIVQHAWASLFDPSHISIRMLSVTLSLLCIPIIVWMGRILHSTRVGLLAGLLFGLSLVQVYYGQETRFYALLNLEATLAMLGLAIALQCGAWWGWLLHGLANTALLLSHAFTPLLFAAQGCFLLWHWRRNPMRVALWTAAHVALLALFFLRVRFGIAYDFATGTQGYNDQLPTWREFVMTYLVFAGGRFSNENPANYMFSLDPLVSLLIMACITIAALNLASPDNAGAIRWNARDTLVFLATWMLVPVILLFAASLLWRPVFQYRYVLNSGIPLLLLVGIGLSQIQPARWRQAAIALLFAALVYQNIALPRPMRPDFNTFAQQVQSESPDATVLAMKPFVARAAGFALGPEHPLVTLYGMDDLLHEMDLRLKQEKCVWVLFHHWPDFSGFEGALIARRYPFQPHTYDGMPPLTAYQVRKCTP